MNIGFDTISDLNLSIHDSFNWENKATSLYCIVAGNISHDIRAVYQTLAHLSRFYQGVFYTPGSLEYSDVSDIAKRTKELHHVSRTIRNVVLLHHHVVVLDGIAVVGANGWYCHTGTSGYINDAESQTNRNEDIIYLRNSIDRLQRHGDVKKVVIVTNSVPSAELYFGEEPPYINDLLPLDLALASDTESKVSHWVYGTYNKEVDAVFNGINFVCNPYYDKNPYWPKRIAV
jgi:hypothetical protein